MSDKDKVNIEHHIKEKELKRIDADIAKIEAERWRIEIESKELVRKFNLPFYKRPWFFQSIIGGIVVGGLLLGFMLDHFLKVTELIKKEQIALKKEAEENRQKKDFFEAEMNKKEQEYIGKLKTLEIEYDNVVSINKKRYEELSKEKEKYADEIAALKTQMVGVETKRSAVSESIKQEVRLAKVRQSGDYLTSGIAERLYLDKDWKPQNFVENKFEEKAIGSDTIVIDNATGLTWQQSGSEKYMSYGNAKSYIAQLNRDKFAEFSDWRLPTLEEAITLLEQKESSNGLFIDPVFDKRQEWIWTSDLSGASGAWVVDFNFGYCRYGHFNYDNFVRAVR